MTHTTGGARRLVAVVTPIVRWPPSPEEETSLRHLRHYLGQFDCYVIGLARLPKELSDFELRLFPARYFADRYGYNRLLLEEHFYQAFVDYEYILIYQLDCLVFASNLDEWCRKGWDYVGAPWLRDAKEPEQGFSGVGNGGLSLRRVPAALQVLRSKKVLEDPRTLALRGGDRSATIQRILNGWPSLTPLFLAGKTFLHRLGYHNNVRWRARQTADLRGHEDLFWAYEAPQAVEEFCIPATGDALEFSFEMAPRYCFERNSRRLPFGCHAWFTYDREFWEPFLLKC